MSKRNKSETPSRASVNPQSRLVAGAILLLLVLFAGAYLYTALGPNSNSSALRSRKDAISKPVEYPFVKEGELSFWQATGETELAKIDIELAKTEQERTQGLMFRRSMPDSIGMLFIFDREMPQSFWMKNTYIPLDILYINSQHQIVSIYRNTVPLSEESLPSAAPALYVLEVIGGFCTEHGINEGDYITFQESK